MEFLTRFFDRFFNTNTTLQQASFGGDVLTGTQCPQQFSDVSRLENTIEDQKRQIARARSLLQSAAFLAGYHQPSLARDIRELLSEIEIPLPNDADSGSTQTSPVAWSLDSSAGHRLSA